MVRSPGFEAVAPGVVRRPIPPAVVCSVFVVVEFIAKRETVLNECNSQACARAQAGSMCSVEEIGEQKANKLEGDRNE